MIGLHWTLYGWIIKSLPCGYVSKSDIHSCMFLSCCLCILEWIFTIYLPESPCSKYAQYLKRKSLQQDSKTPIHLVLKQKPNHLGWVFFYEVSDDGFKSHCNDSNINAGFGFIYYLNNIIIVMVKEISTHEWQKQSFLKHFYLKTFIHAI